MKRASLPDLSRGQFDLLVVGGGIIGCGIARDAALRGLKVALVEREDFGSGTTSRSTRLIHGGLRYLELFDFGLVREDLRERETLLRIAPHLVRPLPFLVPMYRLRTFQRWRLRAGMLLYDLLSFDKSLPRHRFLSPAETLAAEPNLGPDGLQGAARYFDAQVEFPERLCLENALDAAENGALLRTYTLARELLVESGAVVGARVADAQTGQSAEVCARLTVNASGPWLDRTLGKLRPGSEPLLRTTRGVHLVTARLGPNAVVLFARSDQRLFFVVPWRGLSLIGTTDTDERRPPEQARASVEDVRYLLDEAQLAFPGLSSLRPYYSMAGVRALVRQEGVDESEVSRKHALRDHGAEGGPRGLLSVIGGKITGYRAIAQDAVDLAGRKLGRTSLCQTARDPLPGASVPPKKAEADVERAAAGLPLTADQHRYLSRQYGSRAPAVLAIAAGHPDLAAKVSADQPTIMAEVVFAAREESAVTLADVLLRRTPLGFAPNQARDAARPVAGLLGTELGWDAARVEREVADYKQHLDQAYAVEGSRAEATRSTAPA